MTREEAKKRLEVRLICANCPEDKMCYDSHLHSICEYTDYCDEVPIEEAVKVAIEALEQEPCDKCVYSTSEGCQYDDITETIPPFDKTRWIPVSERLPEHYQNILFSTKTDRVFEGRYFKDETEHQWYSFRDECFAWNNVVTAWMPLPEPYKTEGSEE